MTTTKPRIEKAYLQFLSIIRRNVTNELRLSDFKKAIEDNLQPQIPVEKGLLGEKEIAPSEDFGKSENVVEKIMQNIDNRYNDSMDWDDLDDYYNWYRAGLITAKNICTKHLSNK